MERRRRRSKNKFWILLTGIEANLNELARYLVTVPLPVGKRMMMVMWCDVDVHRQWNRSVFGTINKTFKLTVKSNPEYAWPELNPMIVPTPIRGNQPIAVINYTMRFFILSQRNMVLGLGKLSVFIWNWWAGRNQSRLAMRALNSNGCSLKSKAVSIQFDDETL